jgi:hypothetical protein
VQAITKSAASNKNKFNEHNRFTVRLAALSLFITSVAFAPGIPEPGLVTYGAVRNTAAGNARLITGHADLDHHAPSGRQVARRTCIGC